MRVYFDTNLLVAASVAAHPHHLLSFEALSKVWKGQVVGCIGTHGLAEFYSVLTRAPFQPRIHPAEAGRFLEDSILPFMEIVALSSEDYQAALKLCIHASLPGSVIFEALHLIGAQKARCNWLYTFNVKDFRTLASGEWLEKITIP